MVLIFNKFYYVVAILLLPHFFYSQDKLIEEISNVKTIIKSDASASMDKIISCSYDDEIYFTTQSNYRSLNYRCIYILNNNKSSLDSITIFRNNKTKDFFEERFFSFAIVKNKIVLLTDPHIVTLTFKKNKIEEISSIKNEKFFNTVKLLDDNYLFLYINYNFHPFDSPDKHVWAKLNLKSNKIEDLKKMNEENSIFSHFVNNWVSVYKNEIAYSMTSKYKIYLFNKNFELYDSIISNKLDSNQIFLNSLKLKNNYSKDDINEIMKKDAEFLKRIQKIFLLDSTHLLVMLKLPKTSNCEFDLWVKKNGSWSINKTSIINNSYVANQFYDEKNTLFDAFFGNVNGIVYKGNFEFSTIYFPYLENIKTNSFNINTDYNEKINNLVKKNELYYGIKNYRIETK